jgi:hypothetical protein
MNSPVAPSRARSGLSRQMEQCSIPRTMGRDTQVVRNDSSPLRESQVM